MSTVYFLVQQMMFFSIPLLTVALGGMFSERSGVVNIALEGIMVMGAFCSIFFINKMQAFESAGALLAALVIVGVAALALAAWGCWRLKSGLGRTLSALCAIAAVLLIALPFAARENMLAFMRANGLLLLAMLVAAGSGALFSLLHAYASINMRADQTISGTALNMIAPAFAIYMARELQVNGVQQVNFSNVFRIRSVPVLGDIPVLGPLLFQNTYVTTYICLGILLVSVFALYKTRFGLRLRACGEHPQAADSVGVNVYRVRYAGVVLSGALAGLGGLVFVIPTSTNFNATVAGYGFLALAVLIFGQWKPLRILFAALFFGLMKTISAGYSGIPLLKDLPVPGDVYKMIPYIATLIVLAFTSKKSQAPRASGVPYDKGSR